MNKFIKLLIESVDDDFFSDLGYDTEKEVTFLVDNNIGVKNLGKNLTLKDIENIDCIGAILSNVDGCWLLWNLNNEYWDPFGENNSDPIDDFGDIIAICVGKGMFAKIDWSGLTKEYKWANEDDLIYKTCHKVNINGSGYVSTMNIIDNYSEYIQETIWSHLVKESTNDYLLYLPNKEELETILNNVGNKKYKNSNIYKLLSLAADNPWSNVKDYWTSSLYENPFNRHGYAYNVNFIGGKSCYNFKNIANHSIVLLHF